MKRLYYILIATTIASLTLFGCGDSGTGPGNSGGDSGGSGNNESTTYSVEVSASPSEGGTVDPSGSSDYEEGKELDVEATSGGEYTFTGWTGDVNSSDNPLTVTVDQDYNVTANFEKRSYPLTIKTKGEGEVGEQLMKQSKKYESGSEVKLTAKPDNGWKFKKWTGDLEGTKKSKKITVDDPKEVTAVFVEKTYELTVKTDGQGSVDKKKIKSKSYTDGTKIELTAQPDNGWTFKQWRGALSGKKKTKTITMDQAKTVTAKFGKIFHLADNGVTVKCEEADAGDTGTVNGTTYTKRKAKNITVVNAPKTCTSGIKDMSDLFYNDSSFNKNISSWDVSSVTNMNYMFYGASDFNQELNNWDVSNVTSMKSLFNKASSFNGALSNWDVSNVTNMDYMFFKDTQFDGVLNNWDVSSVTSMRGMFKYASDFNGDISGWDVSSVTNMNSMFESAADFNQNLYDWDVSNVTRMAKMFFEASSFNQDINSWNVSNVYDMSTMFSDAYSFNGDISSWDVSNVTDMSFMFEEASSYNQDLSGWDVSKVENMEYMFRKASNFDNDISDWEVGNVENMEYMFSNASRFGVDLSGWCVSDISSKPINFAYKSILQSDEMPNWGNCPIN